MSCFIEEIDETHPDALGTLDLRARYAVEFESSVPIRTRPDGFVFVEVAAGVLGMVVLVVAVVGVWRIL